MATKQIKDLTEKTLPETTDEFIIQQADESYRRLKAGRLPSVTNSSRGTPSSSVRLLVFNEDDGAINVWDGTQWTDASGTPT